MSSNTTREICSNLNCIIYSVWSAAFNDFVGKILFIEDENVHLNGVCRRLLIYYTVEEGITTLEWYSLYSLDVVDRPGLLYCGWCFCPDKFGNDELWWM